MEGALELTSIGEECDQLLRGNWSSAIIQREEMGLVSHMKRKKVRKEVKARRKKEKNDEAEKIKGYGICEFGGTH
jgi:uncharacterized protein with WD repeat